ncbi:MAG: SRPBCC domain-containing protein, partial [Candidatus Limnocylindrales bacterium]
MNVSGSHRFAAPPASVFAAICDPATLMAVIPGCEAVQQTGPAAYEGRIALRLPGAVGSYRTSVRLVDVVAPHRAGMEGDVVGAMGSIRGRADFVLRDAGDATELTWRGDAVIQGPLARLDSRFA